MVFPKDESCKGSNSSSSNGNDLPKIITPEPNSPSEGSNAKRKPGGDKPSVGKLKVGRKRGGRSMGRFPFLTMAMESLEGRRRAESTRDREERNIRMLNEMIVDLKEKGKMNETNPGKFTKKEVMAIEDALYSKGLSGSTIEKYRGIIEGVCVHNGNAIYEEMEKKGTEFSKRIPIEVRSLSSIELDDIQKAANGIRGWNGTVCRFLVSILPYSGLRPSELRMAKLRDLNLDMTYIEVKNPKGKGKYGRVRKATVLPKARPAIIAFLRARKAYLKMYGFNEYAEPLIPSVQGKSCPTFYSSNSFRRFKKVILSRLPEDFEQFSLKTFRATYLQIIMEDHPELLEDASYSMGHSDIGTTQKYYRRIEEGKTVERIQKAFAVSFTEEPGAKNLLIDKIFEVTGYA